MPKHTDSPSMTPAVKRLGTASTRKFGARPAPANLPQVPENPPRANDFIESSNAIRVPKADKEMGSY